MHTMSTELSPHVEHLIGQAVAGGLYPTREALLEAAAERLLEDNPKPVPDEHLAAVEKGLDQLDAGLGKEWDPDDFMRRFMERYEARRRSAS